MNEVMISAEIYTYFVGLNSRRVDSRLINFVRCEGKLNSV